MNKQQLRVATDTVEAIAEHMDMPDVGGNLLALMSSPVSKEVHVIFTEKNEEELADSLASALLHDDELYKLFVNALTTASIKRGDFPKPDPTTDEYWSEPDTSEDDLDDKFKQFIEPADAAIARAEAFSKLNEEEQKQFWDLEDLIVEGIAEGDLDTIIPVRRLMGLSGLKRAVVNYYCVDIAGCTKCVENGLQSINTASSIFRV